MYSFIPKLVLFCWGRRFITTTESKLGEKSVPGTWGISIINPTHGFRKVKDEIWTRNHWWVPRAWWTVIGDYKIRKLVKAQTVEGLRVRFPKQRLSRAIHVIFWMKILSKENLHQNNRCCNINRGWKLAVTNIIQVMMHMTPWNTAGKHFLSIHAQKLWSMGTKYTTQTGIWFWQCVSFRWAWLHPPESYRTEGVMARCCEGWHCERPREATGEGDASAIVETLRLKESWRETEVWHHVVQKHTHISKNKCSLRK